MFFVSKIKCIVTVLQWIEQNKLHRDILFSNWLPKQPRYTLLNTLNNSATTSYRTIGQAYMGSKSQGDKIAKQAGECKEMYFSMNQQ